MALLVAAPAFAQQDPATYVRARMADTAGSAEAASAGYMAALAANPDDQIIAMRAYRQGLAVGDYVLASKAGAILIRAGSAPADAAVLAYAIALKTGDRPGARVALDRIGKGQLGFLAPVLESWAALDRGIDPLPVLEKAKGNPLAGGYAAHHRALLMIAAGRINDAVVTLSAQLGPGDGDDEDLRIDAALLLAGAEKSGLARNFIPGNRPEYVALRKRLRKAAKPGSTFGAARLFLGVAQDIAGEDISVLSIAMTRAALLLDPNDDRARLYLAEALSKSGASTLALAELARVRADSPFYRGAQTGLVTAFQRAGRTQEALALARSLAGDRNATAADARTYGDVLVADSQFAAAAKAYGTALTRAGGDGWELHYLQGSALDRAGRWAEALPALQRAVALGPEEADALEYLGYAQVLRGENLPEAQSLLERASKLEPDNARIADSLAWAYFSSGDVIRALPLLEQAAKRDPGGTQVNEHLGDAYWRLGRKYEARYAWSAASVYADTNAVRRLQGKLANGLN